jgi:glycosyltransferase involved in cell wall biosynthesis
MVLLERSMNCLSVIMPAYNEAGSIELVALRVLKRPEVAELIIVNDASSDGTAVILSQLESLNPKVRVISQGHDS